MVLFRGGLAQNGALPAEREKGAFSVPAGSLVHQCNQEPRRFRSESMTAHEGTELNSNRSSIAGDRNESGNSACVRQCWDEQFGFVCCYKRIKQWSDSLFWGLSEQNLLIKYLAS